MSASEPCNCDQVLNLKHSINRLISALEISVEVLEGDIYLFEEDMTITELIQQIKEDTHEFKNRRCH